MQINFMENIHKNIFCASYLRPSPFPLNKDWHLQIWRLSHVWNTKSDFLLFSITAFIPTCDPFHIALSSVSDESEVGSTKPTTALTSCDRRTLQVAMVEISVSLIK
uniref:Uncharacterized protein n=1 Tax=Schistocephalus solidus TaxID=70667 RepID=A0A0X3P9I8_SCHSO